MKAAAVLLLLPAVCRAMTVATLSNHDASAWSDDSCTKGTAEQAVACNLRVYAAAVAAAAEQNASVVVFPEGYALGLGLTSGFFEPWVADVGATPCDDADAAASPQQVALSCAAAAHRVAVVANFFVALPNGSRVIRDVVYDAAGAAVASYTKHELFAPEKLVFDAGPFAPTVVRLGDGAEARTLGLIICYEGVYPDTPRGDWVQMEALAAAGADAFVWSVGGMVPLALAGAQLARKFGVTLVGSEGGAEGVVLGADGESRVARDVPLVLDGYTAAATVRVGAL